MKKILRIGCLLLIVLVALTGCKAPDPADTEPTATLPPATPTPFVAPTPDPTVTPRVMEGEIIEPSPGTAAMVIDPIDKPPRPEIDFAPFVTVTESQLGVSFNVPAYWEREPSPSVSNAIVYQEPAHDIRNDTGVQSQLIVQVVTGQSAQTVGDAEAYIDTLLNNLLDNYKNPDFSSKADNTMLEVKGKYVTYRVDYIPEGSETPVRMRGRILVVPVDRKLYMVRYICPAEWNSDYEKVYYEVRGSLKELI